MGSKTWHNTCKSTFIEGYTGKRPSTSRRDKNFESWLRTKYTHQIRSLGAETNFTTCFVQGWSDVQVVSCFRITCSREEYACKCEAESPRKIISSAAQQLERVKITSLFSPQKTQTGFHLGKELEQVARKKCNSDLNWIGTLHACQNSSALTISVLSLCLWSLICTIWLIIQAFPC